MIDTKELRRLAQAATPGPWIAAGPSFGESLPKYLNEVVIDRAGDEDDGYSICGAPLGLDKEGSDDMAFVAAANPATTPELLDRLESAESGAIEQARLNGMGSEREAALMAKLEAAEKSDAESIAMYRKARDERESWKGVAQQFGNEADELRPHLSFAKDELNRLRAKVEAMEKQEPVATVRNQRYQRKS